MKIPTYRSITLISAARQKRQYVFFYISKVSAYRHRYRRHAEPSLVKASESREKMQISREAFEEKVWHSCGELEYTLSVDIYRMLTGYYFIPPGG